MSVDKNFGRTLSGATDIAIDNLRLGNNINSIRINGDAGLPNQVLAKNGTTNRLEWDFAETTTIPDGSITGNKLAPNIDISTTGDITGAIITATDKFIQTGTNENSFNGQLRLPAITTLNNGNGLTALNGGNVELFSDTGTTKNLALDGTNGDMVIFNGGDLIGYSDSGTTKTVDIDTSTGDIKVYNPLNGDERIELDGSTGNVIINSGGRLDMFLSSTLNIELNGVNGVIFCRDINIQSHSGLLTLDRLRCDNFNANTITIPEDPPNQGGTDFLLTNNSMTFASPYTIAGITSNATFKSLLLNGGLSAGNFTFGILGRTTTGTDSTGNAGDILMNTGDLTAPVGNITATAGNIIATNGNITANAGTFKSGKVGSKPAPEDSTYTDWALNLSDTNGHGYIGGNLIVNGTIFGNVNGCM